MDIGKSFGYVFDDKDWVKKIAIGGVLHIVPVVSFIPMGYALRTLKNVARGQEKPLPEWDAWGDDFVKGLMVFLASLIYSIPIFVVQAFSAIVSMIAGSSGSSGSDTGAVIGLCIAGLSCLVALWGIAEGLVLPAAVIKYATTGEFGSFFRFGELFAFIRENLGNYIVAILVTVGAFIVAGIVGGILCGVGALFTMFWAMLVMAHLLGQLSVGTLPATPAGGMSYGDLSVPSQPESKPSDQA